MWTMENRNQYARQGLRDPSDVTDAEWDLVRPFLVSSKHKGSPSPERVRAILNGVLDALTCRPKAPSMAGSCAGTATACSSATTLLSTSRPVNWPARRRARRPPLWTARASRALKRGAPARSGRL